jgi:hypothetical protein
MRITRLRAHAIYPVTFIVAALFSVVAMAIVTGVVVFESSGFTFEQAIYLEHIAEEVEYTMPFAIMLNCLALFFQYVSLSKLNGRREVERAIDFSIGTYLLASLVWLSYSMFHVLSGRYLQLPVLLMWLSPVYMLICGLFFFKESRRALSRGANDQTMRVSDSKQSDRPNASSRASS